ncbi:hypothetical protein EVAR_100374_1 [Eumeta japonica]|uniref:Uncharacterized protein n=1 Tax=Eumeta variegata TaxID=151549 RepID=A0A4C1SDV0_EUMVA|nr:hypothetical protein EVAR_100374_1 [Eumeta japonica]
MLGTRKQVDTCNPRGFTGFVRDKNLLQMGYFFGIETKLKLESKSGAKLKSGLDWDDPMYMSVYLFVQVSSERLNRSRWDFNEEVEYLTELNLGCKQVCKLGRWSPLPMDTRDSGGVISSLPASWLGIVYLMEAGVG